MRKFLGLSAWDWLREDGRQEFGQRDAHGDRWYDAWHEIRSYARQEFGIFLEDVLEDALEQELETRVSALVRLDSDFRFSRSTALIFSPSGGVAPTTELISTISVRVRSNIFRDFGFLIVAPSVDILNRPTFMRGWLHNIINLALSHVDSRHVDNRHLWAERDSVRQGFVQDWYVAAVTQETNEKALELLLSHCNHEQVEQYKRNNWFIVIGEETGTTYRIRRALQINIDVLDGEKVLYKLCTVNDPEYKVPIEDQLLAQKTMIELNEREFLDIAKKW